MLSEIAIDNKEAFNDLVVIAKDALAGKAYTPKEVSLVSEGKAVEKKPTAKKSTSTVKKTTTAKSETVKSNATKKTTVKAKTKTEEK